MKLNEMSTSGPMQKGSSLGTELTFLGKIHLLHRAGLPIQVRFSTLKKPNILLLLSVVLCLPLMASGPHFQADEHDKILCNRGCLFSSANEFIWVRGLRFKNLCSIKMWFSFYPSNESSPRDNFSDWSSSQPQLNSIHICNTTRTESQRRDLAISTC